MMSVKVERTKKPKADEPTAKIDTSIEDSRGKGKVDCWRSVISQLARWARDSFGPRLKGFDVRTVYL